MTLPDDQVFEMLRDDFVVGWKNIEREEFCGSSRGYARGQTAVGTTNGAGGHNVQIFVLTPELVVLHALPGFWHPDDFVAELRFAKLIDRLWRDENRTRAQKDAMFARLHEIELRRQPELTTARSDWQSFDRSMEISRARGGDARDTIASGSGSSAVLKPLNVLMHERMAHRPFVPFAEFDVESYVDYGRKHYDNNAGLDKKAKRFRTLEKLMRKRAYRAAQEQKRARRTAGTP